VPQDKVTWLGQRRFNGAEQEHGRRAEGYDNDRYVVHATECSISGHDNFDEKDTSQCSYPGQDPNFVLQANFSKPCERWKGERVEKGFRSRRAKAKESCEVDGKLTTVVFPNLEELKALQLIFSAMRDDFK
jgi:hypothetical protein